MSESYIVDKLFTRNRLHLIFGPLRSGKSTLLLQTEWDWAHGEPIFGFQSYPAHFCHVDVLRPLSAIQAHIHQLGYNHAEIPTVSLLESTSTEERTIDAVFAHATRLVPTCRVIFLDGIQSLCHGNITYQRDVVQFMAEAARACLRRGITLIATAGTSKSSETTASVPVLQRITGSISWGELSGTLTHIGPADPAKFTAPERTISISAPGCKPMELSYCFNDDGKLEYINDAANYPEMDKWLIQITPGSDITSEDIQAAAKDRGYKERSAYYWCKDQVQLGALVLLKRGLYRKPLAQ
jgi:hypothetical protein